MFFSFPNKSFILFFFLAMSSDVNSNVYRPYANGGLDNKAAVYDELRNPLEDLRNSTGISNSMDFVDDLEPVDTTQAAGELIRFAGYRYLATLAACPFNMSQTLLQVQYLPSALKYKDTAPQGKGEEEDAVPDPDDPAYYEYLRARHNDVQLPQTDRKARVDHQGYVSGDMAKPGYQLSLLSGSKLSVLRRLVGHPTEGILSLFKGAFSQWVYDMLHLLLQPTLEGAMNEVLGLYDSAPLSTYIDASAPSALTLVVSSVLVGWLLLPLELVRTRLAIQSASPIHRKYQGTYHALRTVAKEEGGLRALYFSSYHLVPTLLKHTLDPVFRNMGSFALDRVAGIDPYDHPTTFAMGGLAWKTLAAAVMLPINTIRTRLQAQPRYANKPSGAKEFRSCVPLSPVPYTGMANCCWRIVTEEGEPVERIGHGVGHYGLRGLYPGFTLQLVANVAIFGLGFISVEEIEDERF